MSGSSSKVGATRNKPTNFSAYEDNVLCKVWVEITTDAITNTGQRKEAFWLRVRDRYNAKCGSYPQMTQKSVMNRWDHIKAEVSKFSGYMADMIRSNPSGMSYADKSVAAAANFAGVEKHNFTLMHCWHILKDEPKWWELKRKMDALQNSASRKSVPSSLSRDISDLDPNKSSSSSPSKKCPMGRHAAKEAKKKAALVSSECMSKMHDVSVQRIELFKETEGERKARLDEMVALEKAKADEAREHCKMMLEIERERLALGKQRLRMDDEKKEKEEDERILAINLDQCQPMQRMYYQALQEDIIQRVMSRRHGPNR
ncbi:hypothetical protein HU200_035042 [Digitaria exilis]|uniref:No apical meristem-associated C-terminal domain-containing protein n=1 Tax=Digitaria exilis TaxID=1010633 RepID=A0A835BSX6_9POAL|nr:hypothetical protein HU200_035042 [Digitaria exilis]